MGYFNNMDAEQLLASCTERKRDLWRTFLEESEFGECGRRHRLKGSGRRSESTSRSLIVPLRGLVVSGVERIRTPKSMCLSTLGMQGGWCPCERRIILFLDCLAVSPLLCCCLASHDHPLTKSITSYSPTLLPFPSLLPTPLPYTPIPPTPSGRSSISNFDRSNAQRWCLYTPAQTHTIHVRSPSFSPSCAPLDDQYNDLHILRFDP